MRSGALDAIAQRVLASSHELDALNEPWQHWFSVAITELSLVIGDDPGKITYTCSEVQKVPGGYKAIVHVWTEALRITTRASVVGDESDHRTAVTRRGGATSLAISATRGALDPRELAQRGPGDIRVVVGYPTSETIEIAAGEDFKERDQLLAFLPSLTAELVPGSRP